MHIHFRPKPQPPKTNPTLIKLVIGALVVLVAGIIYKLIPLL